MEGNCILRRTGSKLPHNYGAIMKDADSPIPTEKMNDHLHSGVFLSKKSKMYWVEKNTGHNCFIMFPRALSITWGDDERYWRWTYMQAPKCVGVFVEVAELLDVCWLEVRGKFNTSNLSPGTKYEVVFVVMLKNESYGWEAPVKLGLELPNGDKSEHIEVLQNKPKGKWIEIPVGKFRTSLDQEGQMQFSMIEYGEQWKSGLVINSVIIRSA